MKPFLALLLLLTVMAFAQTVQIGGDGSIQVMGDASKPVLATNWSELQVATRLSLKLPLLKIGVVTTNHVSTIQFDTGVVLVTNSIDINPILLLWASNDTLTNIFPLTNGFNLKP